MLNTGSKITELRKQNKMSQADLAEVVNASRDIIGKYVHNENAPFIEMAQKTADVFGETLDYLVGEGQNMMFDKRTLQRLQDIKQMKPDIKEKLFNVIDSIIRDSKVMQTYAR
jgi:transcriptional regulator with XRE-family HTH domain